MHIQVRMMEPLPLVVICKDGVVSWALQGFLYLCQVLCDVQHVFLDLYDLY